MADCVFPVEILHRIIGVAAMEDDNEYSTTKSCALVCYGLFGFCRQLMFEAVEVDSTFSDAAEWDHPTLRLSFAGFVEVLSGDSGLFLGNTIRKLSFAISRVDVYDAGALQQALQRINQLEYLMVTQTDLASPLETQELDVIQKKFKHIFELPTLSEICVSDLPVLSVGPGLKAITVQASRPQTSDEPFKFPTTFSEDRTELESITFYGSAVPAVKGLLTSTRTDGTPVVGLRNLKRVAVHTLNHETLGVCSFLVERSSVGLEEVAFLAQEIDETFHSQGAYHIFLVIVASLKTLKRLTLNLPFADHKGDNIFLNFAYQIDYIRRHANCVEEILLSISTRFQNRRLFREGDWLLPAVVNDVFCDGMEWPHLKRVSLKFTGRREAEEELLNVDLLSRRLSRALSNSKKVQFTLECFDEICDACTCGGRCLFERAMML